MVIVAMITIAVTVHFPDAITDTFWKLHAPTLVHVSLTLDLLLHLQQKPRQGRVPKKPRRPVMHRIALRHNHGIGERVGMTKNGSDELALRVKLISALYDTCLLYTSPSPRDS